MVRDQRISSYANPSWPQTRRNTRFRYRPPRCPEPRPCTLHHSAAVASFIEVGRERQFTGPRVTSSGETLRLYGAGNTETTVHPPHYPLLVGLVAGFKRAATVISTVTSETFDGRNTRQGCETTPPVASLRFRFRNSDIRGRRCTFVDKRLRHIPGADHLTARFRLSRP